ncbi:MAG: helix-turn-helix domain-containing protein [Phototrophicaceae bacterium]|jgi:DNA-binding NarL/FixJ family response regulator
MPSLRLLIAADDPLARAGLVALLQPEDAVLTIGQTHLADADLSPFRYDIALVDLGWDAETRLSQLIDVPLLEDDHPALFLLPDSSAAGNLFSLLQETHPTSGYGVLQRRASINSLIPALQAAANGLLVIAPEFTASILLRPDTPTDSAAGINLTPREREVLDLVAEGLPNKQIARKLQISEYTVKFHVNAILTKLGAASRTEAVVRATRLGLIQL